MYKLNIHSVVDVITNSSTVIYTYCDGCVQPAKELIDAMLQAFDIEGSADDLFYFGVFQDSVTYLDYFHENDDVEDPTITELKSVKGWKDERELMESIFERIMKEEFEQPQWMTDCEESSDDWSSYRKATSLYIIPKDAKHKPIADKIISLVNSVDADGGFDG